MEKSLVLWGVEAIDDAALLALQTKAERLFGANFTGLALRGPTGPVLSFTLCSAIPPPLHSSLAHAMLLQFLSAHLCQDRFCSHLSVQPQVAELFSRDAEFWRELCERQYIIALSLGADKLSFTGSDIGVALAHSFLHHLVESFNLKIANEGEARRTFMCLLMETSLTWQSYEKLPTAVLQALSNLLKDVTSTIRQESLDGQISAPEIFARFGPSSHAPALRESMKRKKPPSECTQESDIDIVIIDDVDSVDESQDRKRASPALPTAAQTGTINVQVPFAAPSTSSRADARNPPAAVPMDIASPLPPAAAPLPLAQATSSTSQATASISLGDVPKADTWAGWRAGNCVLPSVVIDAMNVGFAAGKKRHVSCRGLLLVMRELLSQGHRVVAVIPEHFLPPEPGEARPSLPHKIADREVLAQLYQMDLLIPSTTGEIVSGNGRSQRFSHYDDLLIVQKAATSAALIVSNDNFKDVQLKYPAYRTTIQNSHVKFNFDRDRIFFPIDGPIGRHGRPLADIAVLRIDQSGYNTAIEEQLGKAEQTRLLYELSLLLDLSRRPDDADATRPWDAARHAALRRRSAFPHLLQRPQRETPTRSRAADPQSALLRQLSSMFSEEQVRTAMREHPDVTVAEELVEIILSEI